MANNNFYARIQQKIDTEENWNKAVNFVPLKGEIIIYDTDSTHDYKRIKIGDGVTTVVNLEFVADYDADGDGVVDNAAKLGGKTPGQLTFGVDQIITDEGTDKRLPETLGEKMDNAGGQFTGSVYLQPWRGIVTKVGDANNTDIRFYVDTNGHAVLAVFQNGSWVRTLFEADMNGNYHQGILMPKSGDTFTSDVVHFNNYHANIGSYYGSNTDHNAYLATVSEDGLISQICVDNNMTVFTQQWKDGQYIKGNTIMTDAGGTFTGNVKTYETARTTRGLFNNETRASSTTGTLQSVKYFIDVT